MHITTTAQTRTRFLATPQFGFAHLRDDRTDAEPIHDFLVVQFGVVDAGGAEHTGAIRPNRLLRPRKHP